MYDLTNPNVIRYLTVCYEKEIYMRQKWNVLHKKNILKAATYTSEEKGYTPNDITQYLSVRGMATLSVQHAVNSSFKRTAPMKDYLLCTTGEGKEYCPTMKPIKKEVRELISQGKNKYLKARNELAPEDKYNFMESENWKYGWTFKESGLKLSGPRHGVVYHLQQHANSHVGPQRDPDHYKSCEENAMYCSNAIAFNKSEL